MCLKEDEVSRLFLSTDNLLSLNTNFQLTVHAYSEYSLYEMWWSTFFLKPTNYNLKPLNTFSSSVGVLGVDDTKIYYLWRENLQTAKTHRNMADPWNVYTLCSQFIVIKLANTRVLWCSLNSRALLTHLDNNSNNLVSYFSRR